MGKKPLPEQFTQGFCRLNSANRAYIEHLTTALVQVSALTVGKKRVNKGLKMEKTAPTQPKKV